MDNNLRRLGLLLTVLDEEDDDYAISLIVILLQRQFSFHRRMWLAAKRLRMARIEEDRRIPIENFMHHIDRWPAVQFHEHFRMSRGAFEVISKAIV